MKTLSTIPRPYNRWKAEDLSFLHVLLVWWVALTSVLIKKRQSWTIRQKPSYPKFRVSAHYEIRMYVCTTDEMTVTFSSIVPSL